MSAALAVLLALFSPANVQVPRDPGLYCLTPQGLVRLEGRSVTVARSHKKVPLSGALPLGSNPVRAEILGRHSEHVLTSTPVFYYRVSPGSESIGAGDLVLVKLRGRGNYREFTVSAEGEWNAASGIPLRSQVQFNAKQVQSGVFRLEPADDLDAGEYGFYLFRGRDLPGFLYDFAVPEQ